jgi:hypothetical protein
MRGFSGSRRSSPARPVLRWSAPITCALVVAGIAAGDAGAAIKLRATGLEPRFKPRVHDYTLECHEPVRVRIRTPGATRGRIGRARWVGGTDRRTVQLAAGQAIKVAKKVRGRVSTYSIRCLPADFPRFEYTRYAQPNERFYIYATTGLLTEVPPYVVVVDSWGVPVWWLRSPTGVQVFDAKAIGRKLVWSYNYGLTFGDDPANSYEFRRLDGTLANLIQTPGRITDFHDLQPTPAGNYLLLAYAQRSGVDTSAYNGDADATVYDGIVQEVTPDGQLVSEWSTADHIGLAETGPWWEDLVEPYDITHINAVEPLADGDFLISLRNTNAVYRVDGASGGIEWKLGGTATPQSLNVAGDPFGGDPLGGQHDVRSLGDGVISIHDNATDSGRPPRSVRYRIDGGTATLIDSLADPEAPGSFCCGSTRFRDGHWLVAWGSLPLTAEYTEAGSPTFKLVFKGAPRTYRLVGVDGFSRREFRAGMDAQVPPHR